MRKAFVLIMGEFVLLIALYLLLVRYPFEDSTLWSPGYDERDFNSIQIGDTRDTVLQKLGPPLDIGDSGHTGNGRGGPSDLRDGEIYGSSYWAYTTWGREEGSVAYHVRGIEFRRGRVSAKVSRYEHD